MNCTLLSIAGTGSTFLWSNLNKAFELSYPHDHMRFLAQESCYLVSIRDPLSRLESGFRYEYMYSPKHGRARLTTFPSASVFVHAIFNTAHPLHKEAQRLFQKSMNKKHRGDGGSFFLVPQVRYFESNVDKHPHVFCTPCMTTQWSRFLDLHLHKHNVSDQIMRRSREIPDYLSHRYRVTNGTEGNMYRSLFRADMNLLKRYCSECDTQDK